MAEAIKPLFARASFDDADNIADSVVDEKH